jgi:hypothetical protein
MARFIPNAEIHEPHDELAMCLLVLHSLICNRNRRLITASEATRSSDSIVRPPGVHLLGLRRCQTGDAQIDQQLDAKSVRQYHRLYHPFLFAGEQTKRAAAFTALALRTRWHRPIDLPGSV